MTSLVPYGQTMIRVVRKPGKVFLERQGRIGLRKKDVLIQVHG